MKILLKVFLLLIFIIFSSCTTEDEVVQNTNTKEYNYLGLGESYTIGEIVCSACRFSIQLQDSIKKCLPIRSFF
jgi:acyl-CoA thioesterase-1